MQGLPALRLNGAYQFAELFSQLHVLRVVDGAIDDCYRIVGNYLPDSRLQLIRRLNAVSRGAKAVSVFNKVWISEVNVAGDI